MYVPKGGIRRADGIPCSPGHRHIHKHTPPLHDSLPRLDRTMEVRALSNPNRRARGKDRRSDCTLHISPLCTSSVRERGTGHAWPNGDVMWYGCHPEVNRTNSSKTRNFPLDEGACHGTWAARRSQIPHGTRLVDITTSHPKDLRLGSDPETMRPSYCNQSALARFQCKSGIPVDIQQPMRRLSSDALLMRVCDGLPPAFDHRSHQRSDQIGSNHPFTPRTPYQTKVSGGLKALWLCAS